MCSSEKPVSTKSDVLSMLTRAEGLNMTQAIAFEMLKYYLNTHIPFFPLQIPKPLDLECLINFKDSFFSLPS